MSASVQLVDVNLLHQMLGYLVINTLKTVMKHCATLADINKNLDIVFYNAYGFGKNHFSHFDFVETITATLLQFLYIDLSLVMLHQHKVIVATCQS